MNNFATYSTAGSNGRLGNAMFQIAGTISYALDTGRDFVFPKWKYSQWMAKPLPEGNPTIDVKVPVDFNYAPIPQHLGKNVDLFNGHMQCCKYFAHHWVVIAPYLSLAPRYNYIDKKYKKSIFGKTCSIHVRRTDYDTPVNREYHGVMPLEYYHAAASRLYGNDRPKDVLFVICSDNIGWCKENFTFPNMLFVKEIDIFDMNIMAKCKNNIIANSSFSWWAAWLNMNKDKRVVCPKNWFGPACPHSSKDVAAEGWIVI